MPPTSQVLHVPALRRRHHHRLPGAHHHGRNGEARQSGPVDGATSTSVILWPFSENDNRETRVEQFAEHKVPGG